MLRWLTTKVRITVLVTPQPGMYVLMYICSSYVITIKDNGEWIRRVLHYLMRRSNVRISGN